MLRINETLKLKNVSQKELAERLGMRPQQLNAIIRERETASLTLLGRIAGELGVPLWHLLVDPDEVCPPIPDGFHAFVVWRGEQRAFTSPQELVTYVCGLPVGAYP